MIDSARTTAADAAETIAVKADDAADAVSAQAKDAADADLRAGEGGVREREERRR